MALLVAGISVAVSVGARSGSSAVFVAWGWIGAWLVVPILFMAVRPLVWPGAPGWLTSSVAVLFESSPIGLLANLSGVGPGTGAPIEAVGWQVLASLALLGWAVARLRPASRALYDEGMRGRTGRIKAALRRVARRRPCGDDPMVWLEIHAVRRVGWLRRLAVRVLGLALLASLGALTWHLAGPAFRELAEHGYGPSPEALSIHWAELGSSSPFDPAPGRARLGFNLFLRLLTFVLTLFIVLAIQFWPVECLRTDRKRDTWLGLLATPLTPLEILRGKALGAFWRAREGVSILVALWTVGLASAPCIRSVFSPRSRP